MADISITGANVAAANSATIKGSGTSGAAAGTGRSVYLDPADSKIKLAKADSASSVAAANIIGVMLDNAEGSNQPVTYASGGDVNYGGGLTPGMVYVVSAANAGGIAPYTDLTTGNFVVVLGVAISSTVLRLGIIPASVQK